MFAEVYWWLGHRSDLHPQMTEAEVDACLVSTVALYLGVRPVDPDDPFGPMTGDFARDAARLNAARMEAQASKDAAAREAKP